MFKVWLVNFGWYASDGREVYSLETAKMICKQSGFEARIDRVGFNNGCWRKPGITACEPRPVMTWSPISGFRDLGVHSF